MKTKDMIQCTLCCVLMIIGGLLHISLGPIPLTLQVLMLCITVFLLQKQAWISVALYIVMGLIGLPVFASGGGFGYVLYPSFGFLLGFLIAALIGGYLYAYLLPKTKFAAIMTGIAMEAVIYIVALPYLYVIMTTVMGTTLTVSTLFSAYFLTFLPGDLVSVFIAALFIPRLAKVIKLQK